MSTHDIYQKSILSSSLKYPHHTELAAKYYRINEADPKKSRNIIKKLTCNDNDSKFDTTLQIDFNGNQKAIKAFNTQQQETTNQVCYNYFCDDSKEISTTY